MTKIRVIDLLNKIANREEVPRKIKINDIIYYSQVYHYSVSTFYAADNEDLWLDNCNTDDEIEIIEEPKKIEKITWYEKCKYKDWTTSDFDRMLMNRTEQLKKSLNEIIDYVNKENK